MSNTSMDGRKEQRPPRRSRWAVASLACALAQFPLLGAVPILDKYFIGDSLIVMVLLMAAFLGVAAMVLGFKALRCIRRSEAPLCGRGWARVGQALGVLGVLLVLLACAIPLMLHGELGSPPPTVVDNLRTILSAEVAFHSAHNRYGSFGELTSAVPPFLDGNWATDGQPKGGYFFAIHCDGSRFIAHAFPQDPGESSARWFYTDETGVIRHSSFGPADALCPPIE